MSRAPVLVRTKAQVRAAVARARTEGKAIRCVPTMGFLHEGHGALIDRAVADGGFVVVTIFVNPIQFGPGEDYDRYPRDLERDMAFCAARGADLVFAPSVEEMYGPEHSTRVEVSGVSEGLCGARRPGHFAGVATVVAKLFNIVAPDTAYFGRKDAQQAAVIKRMTADLDFPVEIVVVPTVREPDGLAMSSRNTYLTPEERALAPALYRALCEGLRLLDGGERSAAAVAAAVRAAVEAAGGFDLEYVEVVHPETMRPLTRVEDRALIALAARLGKARLIDNVLWPPEDAA